MKPSELLRQCWQGGAWGVVWHGATRRTQWINLSEFDYTEVDGDGFDRDLFRSGRYQLPAAYWGGDVYFGVNPSGTIPAANKRGNTDRRFISAQTETLAVVNVLYCEFDGKDMLAPEEWRPHLPAGFVRLPAAEQRAATKGAKERGFYRDPDRYKDRARALLDARSEAAGFIPSVVVDSGGGYHAYWFLSQSVPLDEGNRADVAATQYQFVQMMQGDSGVADLRRVLRLPGFWRNNKSGWGDSKPRIKIIHGDPSLMYDYNDLESTVGDWAREQGRTVAATGAPLRGGAGAGDVRRIFNSRYRIADLLAEQGYLICSVDPSGFARLSRPGKTDPSVTVFPADNTRPEVAVMHSSNDALSRGARRYGGESVGVDAWLVYVNLWHGGNWRSAYIAGKKALGLWT